MRGQCWWWVWKKGNGEVGRYNPSDFLDGFAVSRNQNQSGWAERVGSESIDFRYIYFWAAHIYTYGLEYIYTGQSLNTRTSRTQGTKPEKKFFICLCPKDLSNLV